MLSSVERRRFHRLGRALPPWLRRAIRTRTSGWPPRGAVRWGSFRRMEPLSQVNGFDRGTPVDRHYLELFLDRALRTGDFRGKLLEIGDDRYAREIGGWPTNTQI